MNLTFDHAVIVVPELDAAVRQFSAAGFTVVPGGRHDVIPTVNALIALADGGYLELLAPRDADARESLGVRASRRGWSAEVRRAPAIARRFLPSLVGPPGVADWAMRTDDLARVARSLRRVGIKATGPVPMRRARADGVELEWKMLLPDDPSFPFFVEDVTPRSLRVPEDPGSRTHGNGASGVASVRVSVEAIAAAALAYADVFGATPRAVPNGTTALDLAGARVVLEHGAPVGARGVGVRCPGAMPEGVAALGVGGESAA
ncbi:MAG: VOC family protein [Candidatus Eisenbacteria bacterium]|uniref:VOC family protein n=1 Tax=Eiseniibacteriota bacterium TaxID=2212470 RepID=A0A9D6L3R7_UNCEI|nr:VOC family protein [Candidatus Eisenbacteria bacterium]MBI3539247.1 VOC family protein [Candidatus Eisenbacteria bacterium]